MSGRVERLHDAMVVVLSARPGREATLAEIEEEIARRDLWVRASDGAYPRRQQIRARAVRYPDLFEVLPEARVRLVGQGDLQERRT